jgi:hypothetical protein
MVEVLTDLVSFAKRGRDDERLACTLERTFALVKVRTKRFGVAGM